MTGDDHADGGTAGRWDQYKALSTPGCSVADWDCVRGTSYLYTASPLTNTQAGGYNADGFEVALHVNTGCAPSSEAQLNGDYRDQLQAFTAKYPSVPSPQTSRTHCVTWSDYATQPKVELSHGIRMDTNYYHYPNTWIGSLPGYMTGSGLIMRFADVDGTTIGTWQSHTHMNDEADQAYPATANFLLDNAVGPNGYYGMFNANMHTDVAAHPGSDAIVASAQARGVPIITAKQALEWVDGRDTSTLTSFTWSFEPALVHPPPGDGRTGPAGDAADEHDDRQPDGDHSRRRYRRPVHDPDDQGSRIRGLRRAELPLHRDVRALIPSRPGSPSTRGGFLVS